MSSTPHLLYEVLEAPYSDKPTKLFPKASIIYSVETVPPFDFSLETESCLIGKSTNGKLILDPPPKEGEFKAPSKDDIYTKNLAYFGIEHGGLRINSFNIKFTDKLIINNLAPVQVVLRYYNIWMKDQALSDSGLNNGVWRFII